MRKHLLAWAVLGLSGIVVVSCGKTGSDGQPYQGSAEAGAAGVPSVGESEAGAAGSSAGAAGESGTRASLLGLYVAFLGPGTAHGSDSEAELVSLITDRTGTAPKRVQGDDASAVLTTEDLFGADVLIVDNILRPYSAEEAALVANWVASGHGLIVLNGFSADSSRAASLAESYAVTYGTDFATGSSPAFVTAFTAHPVVRGVSSLYFLGGYAMTTTDETALPFATIGSATVGLALAHGAGRVVLWGDDWIELSQELNRVDANGHYPTQTFWLNAVRWASGRN